MTKSWMRAALGFALVVSPVTLSAQLNPKVYCVSAGQCYAAAFQFTDYLTDPTPYTLFSVYLQNLQGNFAASSPSAYSLNQFTFEFFNEATSAGDPYGVVRTIGGGGGSVGAVGRVGLSPQTPYLYHDGNGFGGHVTEYFLLNGGTGFGVLGCSTPPYLIPPEWSHRTCPRIGLNGWFRADFRIRGRDYTNNLGNPTAVATRFTDFAFGFGGSGSECFVGSRDARSPASGPVGNCKEHVYESFVTPEPATLGLVALGLAGLGAARRRPRRPVA